MSVKSSALPSSSESTSGTSSDPASVAVHEEQRQRESFSGPVDSDISALANATAKCVDMLSDKYKEGNT